MTRWDALLEALGVTPENFELEHKAKFDLSPREWLRGQLETVADDEDESDLVEGLTECNRPCCAEMT